MNLEISTADTKFVEKRKSAAFFWKVISQFTGVYLWFLNFSNVLARLVQ